MKDLLASGDLGKPTALTPTRKVYDIPCTPIDRHGNHATDATAGPHDAASNSRSLVATETVASAAELGDDEDDWAMATRPRGRSSVAESREARRSSHGEWSIESPRGRCLSGVDSDTYEQFAGTTADEGGKDKERALRRKTSWKWELPGVRVGGKGGGTSTVIGGTNARTRK